MKLCVLRSLRHIAHVAVGLALVSPMLPSSAADGGGCREHSLTLVPKLAALPEQIGELMGKERAGREGIAEFGEEFNVTDLISGNLPARRFGLAAASENCALVALERGGYGRSIELWSFSRNRAVWQGKKLSPATPVSEMPRSVAALVQAAEVQGEQSAEDREQLVQKFIDAFNEQDPDAMMRMMAPDIQWLNIDGDKISSEGASREAIGASMRRYFKSCPTCRSTLDGVIASPNRLSAFENAQWEKAGVTRERRSLLSTSSPGRSSGASTTLHPRSRPRR